MPGPLRHPVHVFYGGAHLFRAAVARKLGDLALRSLDEHAPTPESFAPAFGLADPAFAAALRERVRAKLASEPVEDFRIDFEDGYGVRAPEEEDGHARAAARELAAGLEAGTLPPFTGVRIKPLAGATRVRAVRTLELFLTELGGRVPPGFRITLPKVESPAEVEELARRCADLERRTGLAEGALRIEILTETPSAYFDAQGVFALRRLAQAAGGRCVAAHFGVYDFTSSLGVTGAAQTLLHPICDLARSLMLLAFVPIGVAVSDSITNVFPIPRRPGDSETVHRAWRLHYGHVRHALDQGFYQGWDLHPAQLPARYAATYAFFHEGIDLAAARLKNFVAQSAQATRVGEVFDDAATGLGLLAYFARAIDCGALDQAEAEERTGLTAARLRSGSFTTVTGES
jgi:citrate lyase beta subunit